MKISEIRNVTVFQDLDGCLADFDAGVKKFTGKFPHEMPQAQMWAYIGNPKIKPDTLHHEFLAALTTSASVSKHLDTNLKIQRALERAGLMKDKRITVLGGEVLAVLDQGQTYEVERDFYNKLDWMSDGKQLWSYVKKFNPYILTGLPMGNWATPQKERWCARELGLSKDRVLTCMARDKAKKAMEILGRPLAGDILIDDREKTQASWIENGGVFILHTSTESTIRGLKEHGLS